MWGGDHIRLDVTETGGALEYDCGNGTIDQPMLLDRAGRFDVTGVHVRGQGGPIRGDEVPDRRPARYTGSTDGRRMALTVTLTDENQRLGTFSLTSGVPARLVKCL